MLMLPEFFSRARQRLTFDVPAGFADPDVIPSNDQHAADPALIAAFAAVRPVRTAAVLVPVIERDEPSVLFTQRTTRLADHGGEISFPGGKIDSSDATPAPAAALPDTTVAAFDHNGRLLVIEQSTVPGSLTDGIATGVVIEGSSGRLVCDGHTATHFTPDGAVVQRPFGEIGAKHCRSL